FSVVVEVRDRHAAQTGVAEVGHRSQESPVSLLQNHHQYAGLRTDSNIRQTVPIQIADGYIFRLICRKDHLRGGGNKRSISLACEDFHLRIAIRIDTATVGHNQVELAIAIHVCRGNPNWTWTRRKRGLSQESPVSNANQ